MAEHTHTTYSCDRCKEEIGSERPKRSIQAEVSAHFPYLEGPGPNFKWRDLCDECDLQVKAFFLPKEVRPAAEEKRQGRLWFAEVLAYANKDMADYIMARARRIMGDWRP